MWVEMCILITTEQESELHHLPFTATLHPPPTLSLHRHPALSSPQAVVGSRSPPCPSPTLLLLPSLAGAAFLLLLTEYVLQTCNFTLHLLPRQHKGEFKIGKKSQKNPKNSWISPLFCALPIQIWPCSYISSGVCQEPVYPQRLQRLEIQISCPPLFLP